VGKVAFPLLIGTIINQLQAHGTAGFDFARGSVILLLLLMVTVWIVRVPLKLLQFNIARRAQNKMVLDLNRRLFSAPLLWHECRHSGDTASRIGQSSGALFNFAMDSYLVAEFAIQIVGPILALLFLSPAVFVGALLAYAVVACISIAVDRYQMRFWAKESDSHRAFSTGLVDTFRNIMTAYATRRMRAFATFLEALLQDVSSASRANVRLSESKGAAIEVVSTVFGLGLMLLYMYLETRSRNGRATYIALGNVFMVQMYVMSGMTALLALVGKASAMMRQRTDFDTSAPFFDIEPEAECAQSLPADWNEIAIEGVNLTYRGIDHETEALRSLDLRLERGRHYALVGANGSGKSTLLKVLAGLLRPDSGAICVDGGVGEFGALRNSASLLPQSPELLEGSLEHNVLIGLSDEDAVAELSHNKMIRELLERLGMPLETHVHEGGANWSGGQRQRIALARGVLFAIGSSIVVVDEPTSSIDSADELSIIRGLRAQFSSACLIVSVHNLELMREFDRVILLRDGAVVDVTAPALVKDHCRSPEADSWWDEHSRTLTA
jgi:ATP-binding cassette subfamily B protein